jgi:UbiD family decarboxylase
VADRDLRAWITKLEAEGELKRVKVKVDWDQEIPEVIRKVCHQQGPALLFENIKGHENTWSKKLFTNGLGTRSRYNLMVGLPKDSSITEMVKVMKTRVKQPLPAVKVKTGPVKENIVKGKDIDLFQFPVPKWHPLDAGRYINTYNGAVTRDPETGQLNVGVYRGMMVSKNKITVLLVPMKDWGVSYKKYQEMGKPMPVAFVYGWDPALLAVAGVPYIGDEYELAGAIRQQPVELVKCEMSDLEVPASAEIVVEGTVSPDPKTYEAEGPFGEGSGYYGDPGVRPVVEVNCITYRNDPIFRGTMVGSEAMDELKMSSGVSMSAAIWDVLDSQEIPGIIDVNAGLLTVIKIHKTYQGQARQIAAALWGSKYAGQIQNAVMVVEEDVDIYNSISLRAAFHDKVDFYRDLVVYPLYMGSPVDPSIPTEKRNELKYGIGVQNKLLIDATTDWEIYPVRPEWGNRRYPIRYEPDPKITALVDKRWKEYGI